MIEIVGDSERGDAATSDVVPEVSDAVLYERHAPELMRFAVSLVGPSDADDVVASAVVDAISARRWRSIENKRAYLFRAVVNEARSLHRGRARRERRERLVQSRTVLELEVTDPLVMRCLNSLSVRQRAVVHLTYWADLAPRQVAELLDTSLRTVERDLAAARARLKELLS